VFDLLDVLLVLAVVLFVVTGYRQGFVVGLLSFGGFLGGGILAARLAPSISSAVGAGGNTPLLALLLVLAGACVGQLVCTAGGVALRRRLTWHPARVLDSVTGAVLSGVSVLLVAWLLATAVYHSPFTGLAQQVRSSRVLVAVDSVMPAFVRDWFAGFRNLVDSSGFPEVFAALGGGRIVPVAPPDPAVAQSAGVVSSRASIIKLRGIAPSCSRQVEGSGFVYAPQRVMTNAHVVAGVPSPRVVLGATQLPARVVLFDPDRDVAVLSVPGLDRPALDFSAPAAPGANAVVAGYPEDGPFSAVAARVRDRQFARGPDIYSQGTVTRDIYAVRAKVLPGNSGGPLLAANGRVYGVVFAAATDDADTGYALTAGEVSADASAGLRAGAEVGTGGCD
jgi:S1-C subfamily serine protease